VSVGIVEVITLLLNLSGFGLQANPSPPTADQALAYAMADADLVVHVDAASIIPGNYKLLQQLAGQPQIKGSPELAGSVRELVGQLEDGRTALAAASGLDITTDLRDATGFVKLAAHGATFVVEVHGRFTADNLDRIAAADHHPATALAGGRVIDGKADDPSLALTKDGVLLVGTKQLVHDRLAAGWQPPSHAAGTKLGYAAEVIAGQPVFALVATLSPASRKLVLDKLAGQGGAQGKTFATDVITRHKAAAVSIFHDGIGWTWTDSTAAGLDDMEQVSSGMIDLLRASQVAPRGLAKIAFGAIDSYRGRDRQLDDLIKHKGELMQVIDSYTGDGSFKVTSEKNVKALKLTVRATGRTVSEVLPLGVVVPLGIIGFLEERTTSVQIVEPVATPATPASPPARKP
jgi:hypothetical protein